MLLYIAGPYSENNGCTTEDHIKIARSVALKVWGTGNYALCPHLNTALMECDIDNPALFYSGTMEMLRRCDGIIMLEGWQSSKGASAEHQYAVKEGMSIWYYPDLPQTIHQTEQESPIQCRAFVDTIMHLYRVHLDKNADYSPANILATGNLGVMTRFWDKAARLMNLHGFKLQVSSAHYTAPQHPKHESIEDSWLDAAVYAIIAVLLRHGEWGGIDEPVR